MASARVGMAVGGERNIIVGAERKGRLGRSGQDEDSLIVCGDFLAV